MAWPQRLLLLTGGNRSRYSKEKHRFGTLSGEVLSCREIPGAFVDVPAAALFLLKRVSCPDPDLLPELPCFHLSEIAVFSLSLLQAVLHVLHIHFKGSLAYFPEIASLTTI